jgi:hypothetical protein
MKLAKTACVALGALALAIPAAASAQSQTGDSGGHTNAAKACKAMRSEMGQDAFRQAYGTNRNGRNSFGKCVSKRRRAQERLRMNAARECLAEREADPAAFMEKYGPAGGGTADGGTAGGGTAGGEPGALSATGGGPRNAFGKCVSTKVRAAAKAQHGAIVNAANACRAERQADPDAFRETYGSNHGRRNAFGKCVSAHVRAPAPEPDPAPETAPTA